MTFRRLVRLTTVAWTRRRCRSVLRTVMLNAASTDADGRTAARLEIHSTDDPGAVLRERLRRVAVEFDGQAPAVRHADSQPRAVVELIGNAAPHRVPLILRDRKRACRRQGGRSLVAEQQAAGGRQEPGAAHERVAGGCRPRTPSRDLQLHCEKSLASLTSVTRHCTGSPPASPTLTRSSPVLLCPNCARPRGGRGRTSTCSFRR
jgi:hypothetical protein